MSISRGSEYTFLSAPGSVGVGAGVRVKLDSQGFVTPANAGDLEIGVVENSNLNAAVVSLNPDGSVAANNVEKRPLRVRLWNAQGTFEIVSTGGILEGDTLKRANGGAVAKWDSVADASIQPFAVALADAQLPGAIVEVLMIPPAAVAGSGGGISGTTINGALILTESTIITGGTF